MDSRPLPKSVHRFGLFELDLENQQLRKAGVVLRIQPQPFKVLTVLISARGKIVTREQLRRALWGAETFVDFEQGLNYCVRQIRTVLGDEAQHPHYVETIPRRGYRFIATVEGMSVYPDEPAQGTLKALWLRRTMWILAALTLLTAVTVLVAGIGSRKHPALNTKDYLLIAEFSNQTGDPVFDETLRKAVSIDLGQSPYLNIVSDDRVRQSLSLMGKPADTRVTSEIGREICQRNGIKAMLTGSLAAIGSQYQLALEVLNANSGEVLAEERVQAAGKSEILNVLGQSNERLRRKLGESLASIQQFGKPLAQVTTSSLSALQLYTLGVEKRREGELASVPFFEQALQLDPDFALAHASLGTVYLNMEQLPLAEEHEKKAMALSGRVSERERLYITAHYYLLLGKRGNVVQTYETYARLYPQDPIPHNNLTNEYNILGKYDKALEHALIDVSLAPDSGDAYGAAASAYMALGRLDDARMMLLKGLKLSPDSTWLHLELSNVALAAGDSTTKDREDAALRSTPGGNLELLYRDAALRAAQGRLRESEALFTLASQLALKLGLKDNASFALSLKAVYEAYLGQPSRAKTSARDALKLSQMSDTIEPVGVALAVSGDAQSETLIDQLAQRRPEDTAVQFVYVPTVHGLMRLHHGDAEAALRIFAVGTSYDRGNLDSMLARGKALLEAKHAVEAIAEFQRVASLRAGFPSDPACALAELGLARAYVIAGDPASAKAAYRVFLTDWSNADTDVPILRQAKAELASLQ